ncbi:MAG: amino acid adenylation domain-containing protein [Oscillospiraceae bacterium]|nr:amino acid adenylation domain-containing protein [Oscillospiraceae bacterium]
MKNILEYLEHSALCCPDKIAVIDETSSCTYRELERTCRSVGTALSKHITVGQPVAVLMEKGIPGLAAFWGIVYAGGCYVLLNPELPTPRLKQIQAVLQAEYVITDAPHAELATELFPTEAVLQLNELRKEAVDIICLRRVRDKTIDTDPLYANFTSGSTGVPKGVVVSHRSVIDFIEAFTDIFQFKATDVFGNQAPFDFDVSVKDIYTSAKVGGTLVIIPKSFFSRPRELLDWICEKHITVMIWAVSALCLISVFHGLDYRIPDSVRKILFSGEVMPEKHLRVWMEHLPDAQFVNLYGPTEITCNCTYHTIDRAADYSNGIPIGRSFPNERVFLLDVDAQEVNTPGITGEICVCGTALALGYYRSPQQTDSVFVQNPLNSRYPERIYKTGDLGKYLDNGELMFCGRKDFQIKYMGHRIELEEIERAIANIPGVDRCCCVFDAEKERLYGFYTGSPEQSDLRSQLAEFLPVYMVPRTLYRIDSFPLNKNGKIDRKQLLDRKE